MTVAAPRRGLPPADPAPYAREVDSSRCSVLHCERAAVHAVPLAPGTPDVGVCGEHRAAMDAAPWVHDRTRGGIVLGDDLAALLQVDQASMQVDSFYGPGLGTFSTLSIDGRSVGTGEPTSIALVLTDDLVRRLSKLIWMFNRTR
jgi:hypothetical protein